MMFTLPELVQSYLLERKHGKTFFDYTPNDRRRGSAAQSRARAASAGDKRESGHVEKHAQLNHLFKHVS